MTSAAAAEGYEDERFESAVPENFHCAICLNVLKEPMQCTGNEHLFCRPCITRYVKHTQRCPICIEPLSIKTLRPARIVKDLLWQLMIRCDNVERGCTEVVKLGALETHVGNCGFNPVKCPNVGCDSVVNKRDLQQHEMSDCDFATSKCDVCGNSVAAVKKRFHCLVTRAELDEVKATLDDTRRQLSDMKNELGNTRREIEKVNIKVSDNSEQYAALALDLSHFRDTNSMREDIIIAGGNTGDKDFKMDNVEMFSWNSGKWFPLQPMKEDRCSPSSFFFQNQVVVCGGVYRHDMEALNFNNEDRKWETFPSRLCKETSGHASVVYGDELYVFGGKSGGKAVNIIQKVLLVPPYSSLVVGHLPEPRAYHAAQIYGDKVILVGGTTSGATSDSIDSVIVFDVTQNNCRRLVSLPFALSYMATVSWKDNIIIIGGMDKCGQALNTVLKYNITNEKSKMLPSMTHKREGCSAIRTQNQIVVMGGENEEEGYLRSVESFDLDLHSWKELAYMNEKKKWGTAVVRVVP